MGKRRRRTTVTSAHVIHLPVGLIVNSSVRAPLVVLRSMTNRMLSATRQLRSAAPTLIFPSP
jgi:hypothetical protein